MKVILGIDTQNQYKPALQLLARLRLPKPDLLMVNAVNPAMPFVPIGTEITASVQAEYSKVVQNLGLAALDRAVDEACGRNLRGKCHLTHGAPADALTRVAAEQSADLVAVCGQVRSMWSPSFLGSVSRGLAIGCRSSLLVAKGTIEEGRRLRVVLATDHSLYSERWIERFLAMQPAGIAEVLVVTAYKMDENERAVLQRNVAAIGGEVDRWIEDHLQAKSQALVDRLTAAGYTASYRVVKGETNDVIRRGMQDFQADMLVLGSQGHGFMDRIMIGSVSLHQVVAEPYPVLVVRG